VFGMEIGEFFKDELAPTTAPDREQELLRVYRRLTTEGQREVLDFVRYKGLRRAETCRS